MHLISPLIAGVRNAENGTARITRRGTVTRAALYSSFEGDSFATSSLDNDNDVILDSYGRAEVYVDDTCDVMVFDADGMLQIAFTAGYSASAIEVRSSSFTGSEYDFSATAALAPISLQAVLDLWKTKHSTLDWGLTAQLPIFVVTDTAYGAKGDGTSDDTAAIGAAMVAAGAVGGVVFFPSGTYRVTSTLAVDVALIGTPSSEIFTDHATASLMQAQQASISRLTLYSLGSGTVVDVQAETRLDQCTLYSGGGGVLVTVADVKCTLTDCTLTLEGQSPATSILQVTGIGSVYATRCAFKAPTTYNPSDAAMVYGNNMHFDRCMFSAATTTAGTFSFIKFNPASSAVKGTVIGCQFDNNSATVTAAMTLGAYGGGSRFYEAGNAAGNNVPLYSYTASVGTSGVRLVTREGLVKNLTDNTGTIAIPTDQYGIIIVSSTHASPVMTGTLPPYGARGSVIFYHPSGGAGTAQPTTNFFGSTAATTANTSSHIWEYVCAAPNAALRMLVTVDGKALGNGAP